MHISDKEDLHGYPTIERDRFLHLMGYQPAEYREWIEQFTSRTVARLCWGSARPADVLRNTTFGLLESISPTGALPNSFPLLRHVPPPASPWQRKEAERYHLERLMFGHSVGHNAGCVGRAGHAKVRRDAASAADNPRSFIDTFIKDKSALRRHKDRKGRTSRSRAAKKAATPRNRDRECSDGGVYMRHRRAQTAPTAAQMASLRAQRKLNKTEVDRNTAGMYFIDGEAVFTEAEISLLDDSTFLTPAQPLYPRAKTDPIRKAVPVDLSDPKVDLSKAQSEFNKAVPVGLSDPEVDLSRPAAEADPAPPKMDENGDKAGIGDETRERNLAQLDRCRLRMEELTEALNVVGLMAIAGALTIGSPLQTYLLAMTHYPDWQARLQWELNAVLDGRCPGWLHTRDLPMLRAVVKEAIRWRPPVPTGK